MTPPPLSLYLSASREKVTEKAVSRLAELVPTYKEKLQDDEVFNNFKTVVLRTKSFATLEMKEAVAEWEAQLRKVGRGLCRAPARAAGLLVQHRFAAN